MSDKMVDEEVVDTTTPAETEEIVELEEIETLHSPNNLLRVVTFAKVLSWVLTMSDILTADGFAWMGTYLQNFGLGFFYFVVLQGIAEGLYILADIFDNSL